MGERRGRCRPRNTNTDSWAQTVGGIDCGREGGWTGENNGGKGGTTVTEQQFSKMQIHKIEKI